MTAEQARRTAAPDAATMLALLAALNRHELAARFPQWRPQSPDKSRG